MRYINMEIPVERVNDVVRLLTGGPRPTMYAAPVPAFEEAPAPRRCGATKAFDGVKVRCARAPRHTERHSWKKDDNA